MPNNTPHLSIEQWRTAPDGQTWRLLTGTLSPLQRGWAGEIVGIEVCGEQYADGRTGWHVSIPECDLFIQARHLGQWIEALSAARNEIERMSGPAGTRVANPSRETTNSRQTKPSSA
jgi:hypothetical protein